MDTENRRSFVKKSLATSMTFTFSGLIRAHGEEGGETTYATTVNPEESTYATTDSGGTTTWNPDESTIPEETTTTIPEETTHETTPTPFFFDINKLEVSALSPGVPPTNKSVSFPPTSNYGESDSFDVDVDYSSLKMPTGSCEVKLKLKAWIDPGEEPHTAQASITVRAEIYGKAYDHSTKTPLAKSFIKGSTKKMIIGDCNIYDGIISPSNGTPAPDAPSPPYGIPSDSYTFGPGALIGPHIGVSDIIEYITIEVYCSLGGSLPAPANPLIINGNIMVIVKWDGWKYHPGVPYPYTPPGWTTIVGAKVGNNPPIPFTLTFASHQHE